MIKKYNYTVIMTSVIACFAGLLMGFDSGVISGALPYIQQTFHLEKSQVFLMGFIVSAVPIGALAGVIISGPIVHYWGRKHSIILSGMLFIAGSVIAASAPDVDIVIIGRLFMGLSIGLATMAVPLYLSEIAPAAKRGAVITTFQLAIAFGLLLAYSINYGFATHENWRLMFLFGGALGILLVIGMCFMPYSPQWLMQQGKEQSARKALLKIRNTHEVEDELSKIKITATNECKPFYHLFYKPYLKLTLFSSGLFMFQQLSGINTVVYYTATVFKFAGFRTTKDAIFASILIGMIAVISTSLSLILTDIIGRRKLFFIGFIGLILSLLLMSLYYLGVIGKMEIYVPIIAISAFIFFFSISIGSGPYIMMSEIFPLEIRHAGVSMASISNWGFNIIVSETFLGLVYYLSAGYTFLLYAILSMVGLLFVYLYCPETKGISLQEIEGHLHENYPLRKLGR